jgi:hypothetical protein
MATPACLLFSVCVVAAPTPQAAHAPARCRAPVRLGTAPLDLVAEVLAEIRGDPADLIDAPDTAQ